MGAAEPRYIAHLLQITIDHVRYAVTRKPEHRLERMARSKHDWRGARHLAGVEGAGEVDWDERPIKEKQARYTLHYS